jgi:hypothetical protein
MMKRFHTSVCAVLCLAAASLPCVGQENPWNGSWKMDTSTVKYAGPTYTVATDAEGYTLTRGTEPGTKTVCDGKPKTAADGTTTTCVKSGSGFQVDSTKNDKPTRKLTISVSADGKTMTRKAQFFPDDNSPFTMTMISKRVSGGPDTSGVWKQVKVEESQDTGILTIEVSGDTVAFKETDNSKPVSCKLDGAEVKISDTSTMSVKLDGPRTLKVTYRSEGKIRRENTFDLSADGKTIKEMDVTPDPSPSTTSMLFHKS